MSQQDSINVEEVEPQQQQPGTTSNEDEGLTYEQTVDLSAATFFRGDKLLRRCAGNKDISKRGVIRALRYALNALITEKEVIIKDEGEAALASALYEMLAARTIMQAEIQRRKAKNVLEENKNGEKQEKEVVAGTGNTEEKRGGETLPSDSSVS